MSVPRCQFWRRAISACFLICSYGIAASSSASPPTLTHLFPAGGQRGAKVTITCHGEFPWPVNIWASGAEVCPSEEKGEFEVYLPHELETDRIWVRLYNAEGASQALPLLIGSLPEVLEVEPNDAPSSAYRLAEVMPPPAETQLTINGVLEKNDDVDGFAVNLTAGQTLVAVVKAHRELASPMDAILQIVSPNGTVLAENHDDAGLDPRIAFTVPQSGQYVVRLFAFPAQPDQRIQFRGGKDYIYRLTLSTGPYISHAFPLSVALDDPGTVAVHGWNLPAGTRLPVASLRAPWTDESPEWEADSPLSGPATRIGFVRAPAWGGSARLRMVAHRVHRNMAETSARQPLTLSCPNAISGCLADAGQTDHYLLPLKKDQQIVLGVEARNLQSLLVPLVRLFDPQGKVVGEVLETGPERDATLTHRAAVAGDYRLIVGDRYRHGGPRHYYRLTLQPQTTDFALSLDTHEILLSPDQPVELPVTIHRRIAEGEALGQITIHAKELPAGVRATRVISEPSGDTASKVTLQLETTGTSFSGRIRIGGTSVEPPRRRVALTPPRLNACFDHLWLTVRHVDVDDP